MILRFKQRFFSWFDSYDIYDENGNTVYVVKGQFSWGHCLKIFDAYGEEVGTVKERIFTFMPKFEMYFKNQYVGSSAANLHFLNAEIQRRMQRLACGGAIVLEWDYTVVSGSGHDVASISKELFNWTDTYLLNIYDPADALCVLMIVLAIDAESAAEITAKRYFLYRKNLRSRLFGPSRGLFFSQNLKCVEQNAETGGKHDHQNGRGCFLFKALIAKVQSNQQQQNHNTAQIDLGGASYGRKAE